MSWQVACPWCGRACAIAILLAQLGDALWRAKQMVSTHSRAEGFRPLLIHIHVLPRGSKLVFWTSFLQTTSSASFGFRTRALARKTRAHGCENLRVVLQICSERCPKHVGSSRYSACKPYKRETWNCDRSLADPAHYNCDCVGICRSGSPSHA